MDEDDKIKTAQYDKFFKKLISKIENADNSKWMLWECGYFDGIKEKVAVVPIKECSSNNEYVGQEYLGLYPYVIKQKVTSEKEMLWIHLDTKRYVSYDYWLKTPNDKITWKES